MAAWGNYFVTQVVNVFWCLAVFILLRLLCLLIAIGKVSHLLPKCFGVNGFKFRQGEPHVVVINVYWMGNPLPRHDVQHLGCS